MTELQAIMLVIFAVTVAITTIFSVQLLLLDRRIKRLEDKLDEKDNQTR